MLGTFSKIVSPGMRIGWIACKNREIFDKLLAYKTTMDLHTNIFCQMVLEQYLEDNDLDAHIERAKKIYGEKAEYMISCMEKYFPEGVTYTKPEGGMFIWVTLPEGIKAVDVQAEAMKEGVAVCAGDPFYENERGVRTMRINYSNSTNEAMDKGMKILGDVMKKMI
jgi:2-aminoadipate transaminase